MDRVIGITVLAAQLGAAGLAACAMAPAWAQSGSNLQSTLPQVAPVPEARPGRPAAQVQGQPLQLLQMDFSTPLHLRQMKIAGARSVPFAEVQALFARLIDTDTTIGAVNDAARQVADLYARHGYAISYGYLPQQDISGGVVQLVVVEGYVSEVQLTGAPSNMDARIRAIAGHIAGQRPLRKDTFERYVSLISRLPGISVDADVQVPANTGGATPLALTIRQKKFQTSAAFDANHPGFEGILSATANGVTPLADQVVVSVMWPTGRYDRRYYSADYLLPLGSNGWTLRLNGYQYDGKPSAFYFNDQQLQNAYSDARVGFTFGYPLVLNASTSVGLELGGYGAESGAIYTAPPEPGRLDLRSRLRAAQVSLNASWQRASHSNDISLQVIKGSKGFGAGQLQYVADLDFTKVKLYARRNDNWERANIATTLSATVQHSRSFLPGSEKIAFGGNYYATAYPTSDATGDAGWAVSGEASRAIPLDFKTLRQVAPYAGADAARVRSTGQAFSRRALASAYAGVRLALGEHMSVAVAVAKPVGVAPLAEVDGKRPLRYNFQASMSY